jgi:hypothetical protein
MDVDTIDLAILGSVKAASREGHVQAADDHVDTQEDDDDDDDDEENRDEHEENDAEE